MPAADVVTGLVDRDRLLRDEDHVGPARDSTHDGDPARMAPHHLDDHDAVVRLGGRVKAVDRLGGDEDCRVESKRVVGPVEIVVDRLGNADHRKAMLLVEPRRDPERVLAADRDQSVEARSFEALHHAVDAALELVWVRPRRPEYGPPAREDPRDLARAERLQLVLDEPAPAVAHADDVVSTLKRPPPHRADNRIESRAVAPAAEDADPLRHDIILSIARSGWPSPRRVEGRDPPIASVPARWSSLGCPKREAPCAEVERSAAATELEVDGVGVDARQGQWPGPIRHIGPESADGWPMLGN